MLTNIKLYNKFTRYEHTWIILTMDNLVKRSFPQTLSKS